MAVIYPDERQDGRAAVHRVKEHYAPHYGVLEIDVSALSHSEIYHLLSRGMREGWRMLLVSEPGCGKTSMALQVAKDIGLKGEEMKVLTAALIDPYTDLVGVPMPSGPDSRTLAYARPGFFYTARVILIDEINRAPSRVVNACLELFQFGTLCGEPLPQLRCVIMAGNPPAEDLLAEPFEAALVDRAEVVLRFPSEPDAEYFKRAFDRVTAHALLSWWKEDLDKAQQAAVSPRRLELVGRAIKRKLDPQMADTSVVSGRNVKLPWDALRGRIAGESLLSIEDFIQRADELAREVERSDEVAGRFVMLLPRMRTAELAAVRMVAMNLPTEMLASLRRGRNKQLARLVDAIRSVVSPAEAAAFEEIVDERLRTKAA